MIRDIAVRERVSFARATIRHDYTFIHVHNYVYIITVSFIISHLVLSKSLVKVL